METGNITQTGHNNITIVVEGSSDVSIAVGASCLTISPPPSVAKLNVSDAQKLDPRSLFIPCIGREKEREDFSHWAKDASPISIRVIIGCGGSGKTRFSIELCQRLGNEGWAAGFLKPEALKRFLNHGNPSSWSWGKPTLIVVDYAALDASTLHSWFLELSPHLEKQPDHPLRILLLERQGELNQGWMNTAFGTGSFEDMRVKEFLDPKAPLFPLPALVSVEVRREILRSMFESLESKNQLPEPSIDTNFDKQLASIEWGGEPLFLMMAAFLSSEHSLGDLLALPRTDLSKQMALREKARIEKFASTTRPELQPEALVHLAAYTTLCGGLTRKELLSIVQTELEAIGLPGADRKAIFADILTQALPGKENDIAPIIPDVIGEAFIINAFCNGHKEEAKDGVLRAFTLHSSQVAASVIRCIQDYAESSGDCALLWLEHLIDQPELTLDQLEVISTQLPDISTALLMLSELSEEIICSRLNSKRLEEIENGLPRLAMHLHNLSIRSCNNGNFDKAVRSANEAVAIYRRLSCDHEKLVAPYLAGSLANLAFCLCNIANFNKAFEASQESVEIFQNLNLLMPDKFLPDLAMSLDELATTLKKLGKSEEALSAAKQSTDIYRNITKDWPDKFLHNLAASLNNLANHLRSVGKKDDALLVAEEAVEIWRRLSVVAPDAYLPDLAGSLNNLAVFVGETNREIALNLTREAVDIYKKLAEKNQRVFLHYLAGSMNNLSNRLRIIGSRDEALAYSLEAEEHFAKLSSDNQRGFLPALEACIRNSAVLLAELGKVAESQLASQRAQAIRCEMYKLKY